MCFTLFVQGLLKARHTYAHTHTRTNTTDEFIVFANNKFSTQHTKYQQEFHWIGFLSLLQRIWYDKMPWISCKRYVGVLKFSFVFSVYELSIFNLFGDIEKKKKRWRIVRKPFERAFVALDFGAFLYFHVICQMRINIERMER